MIPYLDGFSKRMELVACIASVINRRHTREIEAWFEGSELDNILFSVLIHIMERTLTYESKCTLDDIETFLAEILPLYQRWLTPDQLRELTRYIIKDVLQKRSRHHTLRSRRILLRTCRIRHAVRMQCTALRSGPVYMHWYMRYSRHMHKSPDRAAS